MEAAFLESDQRFFHVPCPHCRRQQRLVWQRIEWPEGKPWRPWSALAAEWLAAQGNIERPQAFINTSLAELWDDQAAGAVTEAELLARREVYGPGSRLRQRHRNPLA